MALMLSVVLASSSINALAFNSDGATSVDSVTQGRDPAQSGNASGNGTGVPMTLISNHLQIPRNVSVHVLILLQYKS